MADSFVTGNADRLPWLTDAKRRRRSPSWVVAFVAASAVAVIAALSFWLGMNGALRPQPASHLQPEARVDLRSAVPPSELLQPEPVMPQVEPTPVPPSVAMPALEEARMEAPPVRRVAHKAASVNRSRPVATKAARSKKKSAEDTEKSKYLNPWTSKNASGRMVRVGAYGSLEKSKEAWSRLAELSPAIKQLPAVVTDIPSPTGRTLYWLQIGTTSQAHSEVLCRRMRAIRQRCVVVDLAGARKDGGNERQPAGI